MPIAFGYLLAQNAAYLLVNGQLMLPLLGNPVGMQSWPAPPETSGTPGAASTRGWSP